MMRSIRKLLTLMFVLFIGTCCAPATIRGSQTQIDKFIDSVQKLQDAPEPPADEVPPEVAYKFKVGRMTMVGGVTSISAIMWISAIETAAKAGNELLVIEINSPGGSTDEGFKVAKAIEDSKMQIVCIVDGTAASEAYYILQSCDRRMMTKRSRLMIHEPYWMQMNNVTRKEFNAKRKDLDVFVMSWMEHASARTKLKPKEMIKRCTDEGGDWWLGWQDGLRHGIVDGVVRSVPSVWAELSEKRSIDAITDPK